MDDLDENISDRGPPNTVVGKIMCKCIKCKGAYISKARAHRHKKKEYPTFTQREIDEVIDNFGVPLLALQASSANDRFKFKS